MAIDAGAHAANAALVTCRFSKCSKMHRSK